MELEPTQRRFQGYNHAFEGSGTHILEQMSGKTGEMRQELETKLTEWEAQMQAMLADFDHYAEQIAEIDDFNKSKIEKIGKDLCGSKHEEKFRAIVESQ
mmetsp:Transcript_45688/g.60565  ORF Transcript_45688/g.60565 Transcript_45688/m.60565 type:complete len:99 (+) Transcript_45688:39-335(+)